MAYKIKPNEATLWENESYTSDLHPTKKGKLLITRSLLVELMEQQGKGGDFLVTISAWEKTTRAGKAIINIKMEKPHEFGQPAAAAKSQRSPQQLAEYKLAQLKAKLATIENYPDFEELYALVYEPDRWNVFKTVPAIAKEAAELLSQKKLELIKVTEPIDLSSVISKIDVELSRLNLPAKEHCLVRWDKTRGQLSPNELQVYFDELAIAQPIKAEEYF